MEPRSIFFFETMLTPRVISFVYWMLLFVVVTSGFGMYGFNFSSFIKGLLMIVVGSAMIRIWRELLIVLFKINKNVQKIADSQ